MVATILDGRTRMGGANRNPGGSGSHSSQTRFGDKTPSELRAAADRLDVLAGQLRGLADEMDDRKVKKVHMDGVQKLPTGIKLLGSFTINVRKALLDQSLG